MRLVKGFTPAAYAIGLFFSTVTFSPFDVTRSAYGGPFDAIIVFGDSHSDTGNWLHAFDYPTPTHYSPGRDSNGPVWVEWLAESLNLALPTPSTAGGMDFAWGGARTGSGIERFSAQYQIPRVGKQVETFLDEHEPRSDSLYVLFAGHNDFGYFEQSNPSVPVSNMSSYVRSLATEGARHFVIPTLHPIGHLPAYRGTSREALLDQLTDDFNRLLAEAIVSLEAELDIQVYRPDFHALVRQAIADQGSLGLVNFTDPAVVGDVLVPNPDEYLYWDDHHFTTRFYSLMGERAALSVPEPLSLDVLAIAMAGLTMHLWRRSRARYTRSPG